ncbi:MAG: threonylcarbamoyl-AMP synthase [Candidatus Raymondbacteria bacterium RifOxyC12_full_50_8]|uniref:Threonylcarbamoyl-AMP synthase n=1 Tax=Candidatus Raymondbacteria bacterium RIFOXYD12_FULL_49_13 TaxID=1817890 RepID=A0A1F7FI35_UNCRA|nr:MAG: threonylcarbamoyl-AMP synthase [Candidatus Raymondbacteria bacterium RIFOXYA2_FULL_49_16]OGJ94702.1 MAG: threonylcarbamoyl-AMP synthase [Candidatus Raymondbacteria bacterium RifOxyB12_full_50_8]OGK01282.1 MAG: threonylcarbamoyl-AMP synthase [Candidatus Raymondbacteria bacterium RifOxyC12_full_50_8]OGK06350.1 MAG: threonylcarbamoyl-AMP synthase [Candidatus Raymondbacteria bacterium RIFOXYD12_FULL_49_13]OGP40684.1 MAG: threonylcarbamoyl-AMP synthase [Candidatus Raymondbacteria bacterium R
MSICAIHPENPQNRLVQQAAQLIKNGGVIAYPSDTTYALCAEIFNKKAVDRLYMVKRADKSRLFSCICYDFSKLSEYAHISTTAYRIMKHHLPGPYTFILKGKTILPKLTLTKRKTIGVRMPKAPIAQALYEAVGSPLLSCGIRLTENEVLNDPHEINKRIGHEIDMVIDGGEVSYAPSSIISLEEDTPVIIRHGSGDLSYFGE